MIRDICLWQYYHAKSDSTKPPTQEIIKFWMWVQWANITTSDDLTEQQHFIISYFILYTHHQVVTLSFERNWVLNLTNTNLLKKYFSVKQYNNGSVRTKKDIKVIKIVWFFCC